MDDSSRQKRSKGGRNTSSSKPQQGGQKKRSAPSFSKTNPWQTAKVPAMGRSTDRPTGPKRPPERTPEQPRIRKRKAAQSPSRTSTPDWLLEKAPTPGLTGAAVEEIVHALEITANSDQLGSMLDHLLLIKEYNREINLVSRMRIEAVLLQSLWESLVPSTDLSWKTGTQILDLGTGGGFPGIPMAIMLPDSTFTLIDSRRAKVLALKNIVEELKLSNIEIVHDRAEIYAEHVGRAFDTVAVKAVGMLKEVAPWSEGLLREGGKMLAWKGPEGIKEYSELQPGKWAFEHSIPVLPHRTVMVLGFRSNL